MEDGWKRDAKRDGRWIAHVLTILVAIIISFCITITSAAQNLAGIPSWLVLPCQSILVISTCTTRSDGLPRLDLGVLGLQRLCRMKLCLKTASTFVTAP
jgi:uncharacterized membrane protein YhdT